MPGNKPSRRRYSTNTTPVLSNVVSSKPQSDAFLRQHAQALRSRSADLSGEETWEPKSKLCSMCMTGSVVSSGRRLELSSRGVTRLLTFTLKVSSRLNPGQGGVCVTARDAFCPAVVGVCCAWCVPRSTSVIALFYCWKSKSVVQATLSTVEL